MSSYPDSIPFSVMPTAGSGASRNSSNTANGLLYKQRAGYYAVHYGDADMAPEGAEFVMAKDGGGAIAVFRGDPPSPKRNTPEIITPVYGAENGVAAVPTGQVFIRFADGIDALDRTSDLHQAGYETVKVLDFAPQGAWVRARSGSIADSLQQLQALTGLEQVEAIEPQMLMQRSLR